MTPANRLPPPPPTRLGQESGRVGGTEKQQRGAEERTAGAGAGRGWLRGQGLRFGCLTQRGMECKELIRSGVSLPQTKGQASRQRLREGERRVREGERWGREGETAAFPTIWSFCFEGGWRFRGGGACWVAQRWTEDTPPPPPPPPCSRPPGPHPQPVSVSTCCLAQTQTPLS